MLAGYGQKAGDLHFQMKLDESENAQKIGVTTEIRYDYRRTYLSTKEIYAAEKQNTNQIKRYDLETGKVKYLDVPGGLIEKSSGQVEAGDYILTSNGEKLFNIASNVKGEQGDYNGWTVQILPPGETIETVDSFEIKDESFRVGGAFIQEGKLYLIEDIRFLEGAKNRIQVIDLENRNLFEQRHLNPTHLMSYYDLPVEEGSQESF